MELNIEELFRQGNELLNKCKYDKAFDCFKQITESGDNEYLGGSYVNMAKCLNEGITEDDEDRNREIETYLDEALKIKPTNQAAFANYFWYHLRNKRFNRAIECFLKVEVKQYLEQCIFFLEKIHDYKNEEDADAFYKVYKKYPQYSRILIHVSMWYLENGSPHKAYQYLREALERVGNDINVLSGLSLVCTILNNPEEAEDYCKLGLNTIESLRKKDDNILASAEGLQTNLALSYLHQGKFEEVESLLSEKVKQNPNNTDYHNLAFAQYMLGKLDEAFNNCTKALYISEDETSFFLLGECFFSKHQYEDAIIWYKRALAFMEEGKSKFIFDDRENISIVSSLIDAKQILKTIYINLVHAFLESSDFVSAKAFHNLALNKFPFDNEIRKLTGTLKSLDTKAAEGDIVNQKIQSINIELDEQRELLQSKMQQVKTWALELIKLQNRCVKNDQLIIQAEEDWKVIENQMITIADAMKSNIQSEVDYQQIADNFKGNYGKLNEKSFKFLCTGEYLYQVHLNDKTIDFAPIMIEFCKVIENELNDVLKQKKFIDRKRNYTLGQLLFELERLKTKQFIDFVPVLKSILGYRNGSAHTGSTTSEKTSMVRGLLINDGWLNFILTQK